MSTYVLIPGAGGAAWYWHRVVPLLQQAGHETIAVDLPGDDPQAALPEYTGLVIDAIGARDDVVLVAQSLGGFTAPLVAAKVQYAAPSSARPPTSCTTSRHRSRPTAHSTSGPRPTRGSARSATSPDGRRSRSGSCSGRTTGSSPPSSSRQWRPIGSGGTRTCCPAAT
jgi:Alpha/beta hydrolase family